ncbi:hypothetical protein K6Y31_02925 [Motilimonas cestriensis]|uniref:Uncharacterized protein n=1 Tax=Motilimonas cestriensis TaxID=2742685 RepID=A0ABS8W8Q6_9GAMM|nr:hypothetical protein [Motilimonas cestriensis]MCE2593765.1 hypothetical protein [Motilimonas cestriensis]
MSTFLAQKRIYQAMRNVLGILFFIVSGFFVYMLGFLSFFKFPGDGVNKFLLIGVICIPLLIFHGIGLALYRGGSLKKATGITFLVAVALNAMVAISMFSFSHSDELAAVVDTSGLDIFSDYTTGFMVMAVSFGLGLIFYFLGRKANKVSSSEESAVV